MLSPFFLPYLVLCNWLHVVCVHFQLLPQWYNTIVRSRSPCTRKYYCKNCLRKRASYPAYRKYLWPMASRRSFYAAQGTGRSGRLSRSYV